MFNLSFERVVTCAAGAVLMAATALSPATAATVNFGVDLNPNPGADTSSPTRLSSFPNATAARNAFLSGLTTSFNQDFETFSGNLGGSYSFNGGASGNITASLANTSSSAVFTTLTGTGSNGGRYATSGSNYITLNSPATVIPVSFSVNFSSAIAAFGFYATDIADTGGTLTVSFSRSGLILSSLTQTISPGNGTNNGGALFLGLRAASTAEIFDSVTFTALRSATTTDFMGFDDFTTASFSQLSNPQMIPEPPMGALATLVPLGLLVVRGLQARKSAKAEA